MTTFRAFNAPSWEQARESEEVQVLARGDDGWTGAVRAPVEMDSTNVDAGNTPTTTLRGGNVVAIQTADGNGYLYDPDAADGSQCPVGVLPAYTDMLNKGVATDTFQDLLIAGILKEDTLVNADAAALATLARLGFRIIPASGNPVPTGAEFGDHPSCNIIDAGPTRTVLVAENGALFTATGTHNFTLPTIAHGLQYRFFQATDNPLIVTGSSNIIAVNNAAASTLTFNTASQQIGSHVRVEARYEATGGALKWFTSNLGGTTMTVA